MPYTLVFILLIILSLYEFLDIEPNGILGRRSSNFWFYLLCACMLWLIAALRFETGRDWQAYIRFFDVCDSFTKTDRFELGFIRLNQFFKKWGVGFYGLQFFISSFCAFFVFRNIFKTSEYPAFTLLLYVFMFYFETDMAQTRQHIAMSILICGSKVIKERKLILWCCVIAFAMMFHISAITAFPLYFTYKAKIDIKIVWILFGIYVVLYLFGITFVLMILKFVLKLSFLPSRISAIGSAYLASKRFGQQALFGSGLGFLLDTFFNAFIVFMFCQYKKEEVSLYFVNFFVALYFMAFGRNFDQFARIANYYYICGNGLCAYNLLIKSKGFFRKVDFLRYFMCFIFLAFRLYTFYSKWFAYSKLFHSGYYLDYLPYKAFLFR